MFMKIGICRWFSCLQSRNTAESHCYGEVVHQGWSPLVLTCWTYWLSCKPVFLRLRWFLGIYCLKRELDSNSDTFGYFFSHEWYLDHRFCKKSCILNELSKVYCFLLSAWPYKKHFWRVFSCPHGPTKHIFERFLAVRMALQNTFLKGL